MVKLRKKYSPGCCNTNSGIKEIRWDTIGCNLSCDFCWSPASRPEETLETSIEKYPNDIFNETYREISEPSNTFIRFTGGEPTLYWNEIIEAIYLFQDDETTNQVPILIQTNGVELGRGSVNVNLLDSIDTQLILFELSFKGTNRNEFSLLTRKNPEWYAHQISAYNTLLEFSRAHPNIQVVAVLGVYHSSMKSKSKYAFTNPLDGTLLFDDETSWEEGFTKIWKKASLKWVEPLRWSPPGLWKNVYKRCGPTGSNIIQYYKEGITTNPTRTFNMKPKTDKYGHMLVERMFW